MTDNAVLAVVERLHPSIVRDVIGYRPVEVILLERPRRAERRGVDALERAGIVVRIPDFFAGHLLSSRGDSVWVAAGRVARVAAPIIARGLIRRSPILNAIDEAGRARTLSLHLSKCLLWDLAHVAIRLEVARALAAPNRPAVWIDVPASLPLDAASEMAPDLSVFPVRARRSALFSLLHPLYWELRQALQGKLAPGTVKRWTREPTILTVHEEDLNDDRSYRGQLHWLDTDREEPRCRVVILPQRGVHRNAATRESLARRQVTLLTEGDVAHCLHRARHPVQATLARWARTCFRMLLTAGTTPERFAAVRALILVRKARRIGAVAEATGARAWVGCESYYPEADAVSLVADAYGLRTAAWQYSAMMTPTPLMLTTADVMATFSEYFAPLYAPSPVGPASLLPIGYPFGDVPLLVRKRAHQLRRTLESKGVRFVLCFVDESIARTRWHGLINPADHLSIVEALARIVLSDPDFGVILKPKYAYDTVDRSHPQSDLLRRAIATGRFVYLVAGVHRNEAFVAEAALAADICVGFLAGATGALEAVIAGSRAVLLRHRGEVAHLDPILQGLDVIYPSMEKILDAVAAYRAKDPARAALGDWAPVLPELDAHRDGKAPARLRALLEGWALGQNPACRATVREFRETVSEAST